MGAIASANAVLNVLEGSERYVPFGEIVRRTGLPKSSVHDVLSELVKSRMIERGEGAVFRIGLRVVELASARLNSMSSVQRFLEVCASWHRLPDESVVLSVLDGMDVVYLAVRSGSRLVGIQYHVGMRLPAFSTASGKAILAWREREYENLSNALRAEMRLIRKLGYSVDDEETAPGMICFGAAVRPVSSTDVWCAVATSFVKASITAQDHTKLGEDVKMLANALR